MKRKRKAGRKIRGFNVDTGRMELVDPAKPKPGPIRHEGFVSCETVQPWSQPSTLTSTIRGPSPVTICSHSAWHHRPQAKLHRNSGTGACEKAARKKRRIFLKQLECRILKTSS